MSSPNSPNNSANLDTCGCCEPSTPPPALFNRPGLPALAYRIGTQPAFLQRMLDRLAKQAIPDGPNAGSRPLAALTTRSPDDPSIALLDAWATVADVLTFYQERIANEGYLRTATERYSVLELAREIGYELNPGVAASAFLTFTLDDSPGAPATATISTGTRVQSVPPQGKQPQTFETIADLAARVEWNALKAQTVGPQPITRGLTQLYLAGTDTHLQPGDAILIVGDERVSKKTSRHWDFRILQSVESNSQQKYTRVTWSAAGTRGNLGGLRNTGVPALSNPRVYALRQRAAFYGFNAPDWANMSDEFRTEYSSVHGGTKGDKQWPGWGLDTTSSTIELDAPYPKLVPDGWLLVEQPSSSAPSGSEIELFQIQRSMLSANSLYALSTRTTAVLLDKPVESFDHTVALDRRTAIIYAQSEPLNLAQLPLVLPVGQYLGGTVPSNVAGLPMITSPVSGYTITLDHAVPSLQPKQPIMVTGQRVRALVIARSVSFVPDDGSSLVTLSAGAVLRTLQAPVPDSTGTTLTWHLMDQNGVTGSVTAPLNALVPVPAAKADPTVSEANTIQGVSTSNALTTISIAGNGLQSWYDPATVSVSANVAPATAGETVREVLGSGDGTQTNQSFVLKRPPLTYIPAATPTGGQSSLSVSVAGVKWQEQPSLYGLDARSQSYTVRIGDDTKATVAFGDGSSGARLPTGVENVTAVYRTGTGVDGNVDAGSLTTLQMRPLGVRGVTNPVAASGGADPERLEDARQNAPLKVLTLDRMVSLQDYEDFARAFSGVGKAQAVALWSGETRLVHITLADAQGNSIPSSSSTYTSLQSAIGQYGDPTQQVMIQGYIQRTFSLAATLTLDPRYDPDAVRAQVRAALSTAFSFAARDFGQPVTAAEVITLIQGVPGVVALDLASLQVDAATSTMSAAPPVPVSRPAPMSEGSQGYLYNAYLASYESSFLGATISTGSSSSTQQSQPPGVPAILPAQKAHWEGNAVQAAELIVLNPRGVTI